jgi:transcriptional regulatory protein RtcR
MPAPADLDTLLDAQAAAQLDRLDALQLQAVVQVCRESRSLSKAGRNLFAVSRQAKHQPNDAGRLKKYLVRFGLTWDDVQVCIPPRRTAD